MNKEKSITITLDEFLNASATACTNMIMGKPHNVIIMDEFSKLMALLAQELFNLKED